LKTTSLFDKSPHLEKHAVSGWENPPVWPHIWHEERCANTCRGTSHFKWNLDSAVDMNVH